MKTEYGNVEEGFVIPFRVSALKSATRGFLKGAKRGMIYVTLAGNIMISDDGHAGVIVHPDTEVPENMRGLGWWIDTKIVRGFINAMTMPGKVDVGFYPNSLVFTYENHARMVVNARRV